MKKTDPVAQAIKMVFVSQTEEARDGRPGTVVDGLFAIAEALTGVAAAIHKLGLADAATPMGAAEVLSQEFKDGFQLLAGAIDSIRPVEDM